MNDKPVVKSEWRWEILDEDGADITERMRIWHGWLYRTSICNTISNVISIALVFVPDSGKEK